MITIKELFELKIQKDTKTEMHIVESQLS